MDAGHTVRLLDNDLYGWSDKELVRQLRENPPACVLLGHTSSTAAHPVAMRTAAALRESFPSAVIVYGGVYASYAAEQVLADNPQLNVVVRGEGEQTVLELAAAIAAHGDGAARLANLQDVDGITWRGPMGIVNNPNRAPIADLDRYRPGWELVDWPGYRLFGFGRSAGVQFSRGCTLSCTYCGQWGFWRKWRHRSAEDLADQLELLATQYGVRIVWLADENFAADREAARQALQAVADRGLDLSLNLNMTAADVVRDADLLSLYKRAGVDNIVMGVESTENATVEKVRKNNPFAISCQATRLLREHSIVGLVNIIYGLEQESFSSVWRTFRQVLKMDADVLNAVYLTPHHWTVDGRKTSADQIVQPNQHYWTYRNQVLATERMRPTSLFLAIKVTEALFHLRPRSLYRMLAGHDHRYRKILRAYLSVGSRVVWSELVEYFLHARQVRPGALHEIPGFPREQSSPMAQRQTAKPVA